MAAEDRGDDFTPSAQDLADSQSQQDSLSAIVASTKQDAAPETKLDNTEDAPAEDAGAKTVATEAKTEDDEPKRDDKGRFIPKTRFDEAVQKERSARETAERKLSELQQQMQSINRNADISKLEGEIQGMEKEYAAAMMDGSAEKAAQLMTQIRLKERTIALAQSESMSAQARAAAAEEIRMETAISTLESTYSVMNPNDEAYDQDVVDLVLGQQQILISTQRMAPSQALAEAAKKVMSKLMPAAKEDPVPSKGLGAAKGAERTASQKAKNVDTAKRQPPSMDDVGIDSDKAGAGAGVTAPTSIADLSAIPEATLKRMRGDLG